MDYDHIYKFKSLDLISKFLAGKLIKRLQIGDRVTWLVSGGSAVNLAVEISKDLEDFDLSQLHISLVDERYGPVGHSDSNWQLLINSGFSAPGAHLYPVLKGGSLEDTTADFNEFINKIDGYKIALLGLGADNHTAGVLPNSPAITSSHTVVAYQEGNYSRITMSLAGLKNLDEAVVYSVGESKRTALENLASEKELPINQFPSRIIRQIANWSVYNDLIGEEI